MLMLPGERRVSFCEIVLAVRLYAPCANVDLAAASLDLRPGAARSLSRKTL